jgi:TonB-dependent receptor
MSVVIGGENIINDWTIEYALGHSTAEENEPNRIDSQFEFKGAELVGYRYLGLASTPVISASADTRVPENFELDEIVLEDNTAKDEETSFNFDITKDMMFGDNPGYIKFGAKLRSREKEIDVNARVYDDFEGVNLDRFISENTEFTLGNFGPEIDFRRQRAFVANNITNFSEDTDASMIASARDSLMEEDITAVYLMSRVDIDDWRLVYGVRYEQTDFKASGSNVREVDVADQDNVQVVPTNFESDYSHVLPSINVRYNPSDDLIMRMAYSQSIARPSFGQLTPTADTIEIEQDSDNGEIELNVETGNPELEPYESQNFDFSVDYYPGKSSVLSAGLFYKQIDNFIFNADVASVTNASEFAGSVPITDVNEVIKPLNGESADLMGLELSWTRQFMDLPSPFDGFLLMANATLTDSEADLGIAADAERGSDKTNLPLQADQVFNFAIGYEKYGLSLRLSYAHISERILEIDFEDSRNDLYEDSHKQIDFTAKYDVNNNFQVFFSAINLNEEPNYRYRGEKRYIGQYDEIGQSYILGVTYRNF